MRSAWHIVLFAIVFCMSSSGCFSLESDSDGDESKLYRYSYILDISIGYPHNYSYLVIAPIHVDVEKFADNFNDIYVFLDKEPEYMLVETDYGLGIQVEGNGSTLLDLKYDLRVSDKKDYSFTMNPRDNVVMMYCEFPHDGPSISVQAKSELSDVHRDDYNADPYKNLKYCSAPGSVLANGWNEVEYRYYDWDEW